MNLLFSLSVTFNPHTGGVQRSTSKLAKIFSDQGHRVVIVVLLKGKDQEWEGIPVYYIGNSGTETVARLKSIIEDYSIEIIINQMGKNVSDTRLLAKCKNENIKLINTLRIDPLHFVTNHRYIIKQILNQKNLGWINSTIFRKIVLFYHKIKQRIEYAYLLKIVDKYIMLSESFRKEIYTLYPGGKKYDNKIAAIPNPFFIEKIDLHSLVKENVFLFVGRLNIQQKRTDLLMSIWKDLHTQLPEWKFWVVGEGMEKKNMEEFCKKNNMNRVEFFGHTDPVPYYKKAKILHFTSAYEGFGNVLIEAQMYGCVPVLYNSYSAAEDIIEDNKNGFLIKPFNTDDFKNKTLKLINDKDIYTNMSLESVKNARRYDIISIIGRWYELFSELK